MADKPHLEVSVHGPKVGIEDVIKVGEATKRLLGAVGESMGVTGIAWQITSVQFKCDGCGLTRPDRPSPDEGWSHADGDDFCPACTAARA